MAPPPLSLLHLDTAMEHRGGQRQLLLLALGLAARSLGVSSATALFAGMVFALHPLGVEIVAMAPSRSVWM